MLCGIFMRGVLIVNNCVQNCVIRGAIRCNQDIPVVIFPNAECQDVDSNNDDNSNNDNWLAFCLQQMKICKGEQRFF